MLLAVLTPLIANAVTIFSLIPLEIDLTPYAFTVTGVGMAFALYHHRFLDIAPIVRDLVIGRMTDGMIVTDANGRIVDINLAAQTMIGLADKKQPINKSLADVLSQWPELIERYKGSTETKDEISIGEDNSKRWYELSLSTLKDENQTLIGQVITIRDITERKHTERQIVESEARFRQIVENASDLIYRVNTDGELTYANPAALRAMGFESEEEALGKHYLALTTPEMRHKLKRTYQHQLVSKTKVTYHEFPAIAKDGSEVWFGQNVQLIYEDDQVVGFQALARDITAIKQAQDAIRIARDQALEASRAKTQLLSKVSHELRTPLGGILGYAELIQGNTFGQLNSKQNKAVTEIMDSAEYLGNMVNELLDEAQLRSNTASLIEDNFSPFKLVQAATSGMDILAQKKGLTFSMQIDPNLPQAIYGDERRIRQIIINLIRNAIKFTEEGSVRLIISLVDENHWDIQVTDTGVGIPKEAQSKIFEPFKQVSLSVTSNNRGVGLGLSVTKQLVDLMHGRIVIESEPSKGSTFTVLLPITREG
ncbi:MAG TPA: PAS domain S-box protein [Anaerolineales bacterium]|nr:PAS domain S-box protein [Anaerolineales bacterium]